MACQTDGGCWQVARGCERNVITYSALISACEKAGRWQLALNLLDEMQRDKVAPNTVTFNSLISACAQGVLLILLSQTPMYCPDVCTASSSSAPDAATPSPISRRIAQQAACACVKSCAAV